MGDIADDIISGFQCQYCGEILGEEVGYPRSCAGCEEPDMVQEILSKNQKKKERVTCSICKRSVKVVGLDDHMRDVHTGGREPKMMVVDPLSSTGKLVPIQEVLRSLAAQEGCDGEPYDQMMQAADRIDDLEWSK